MRVVATAGENDDNERMMRAHAMVENENFSMAGECYRLLSNQERVDGVASDMKHVKRESEKKVQSRMYFLQKHEDVEHDNLKCTGKLKSGPGKRNGLRNMYNIRADPDLGVGYSAVRRIPCGCKACTQQIQEPWLADEKVQFHEQPRYKENKECQYWNNFHGLNEWQKVTITPTKVATQEDIDFAHAEVLEDYATRMSGEVQVGKVGAFSTDDERYKDGYYLVEWTDEPYTLQEDIQLLEYDPPARIQSGELVGKAKYLEKVPRAKFWYTPTIYETTVRMKNVLSADVNLLPISAENIPRGLGKKAKEDAIKDGAMRKISEEENAHLRHRIATLDLLEHADDEYAEFVGGDQEGEEEEENDADQEQDELDHHQG
jgi:hypothetical protein